MKFSIFVLLFLQFIGNYINISKILLQKYYYKNIITKILL